MTMSPGVLSDAAATIAVSVSPASRPDIAISASACRRHPGPVSAWICLIAASRAARVCGLRSGSHACWAAASSFVTTGSTVARPKSTTSAMCALIDQTPKVTVEPARALMAATSAAFSGSSSPARNIRSSSVIVPSPAIAPPSPSASLRRDPMLDSTSPFTASLARWTSAAEISSPTTNSTSDAAPPAVTTRRRTTRAPPWRRWRSSCRCTRSGPMSWPSSHCRASAVTRILRAMGLFDVLPATAATGPDGRLTVGGCAVADLAAEFGTPAFVVDEEGLRARAREYLAEFGARHAATDVHFASKALPCAPVTRILAEEGLGCDVASAGELAIALAAGFDPEHILLHGNAKSDRDIGDALAAGVGVIVIDGPDDVDRLERFAPERQRVLLRVNPAVPGATHAAMDTGSPEAKFGVAVADAPPLLERIAAVPGLDLLGLHVHIGSQLLDLDGFGRAAAAIAALGTFPVYDLGGGLGITYRPQDDAPSVADY